MIDSNKDLLYSAYDLLGKKFTFTELGNMELPHLLDLMDREVKDIEKNPDRHKSQELQDILS